MSGNDVCWHAGCNGHVSRLSSCLDEVIYQHSLEFPDEVFGHAEWHGHLAMIEVTDHASFTAAPESSDIPLTPEPGIYTVWTWSSGDVWVHRYQHASAFEADWEDVRKAWYSVCDDW
jgi:hypothetical protein